MPLSYGFASSTAHSIPKPTSRSRREAFRLTPLTAPDLFRETSAFCDNKHCGRGTPSSSWNSRFLCAMTSPSDASFRTGPLSPPTPSSITAYPTKRTINPGLFICKGEGHSVRHSWIVGGRLVEFPFPETRSDSHVHTDEQQSKPQMEEGTRPPIPIPAAARSDRTSKGKTASIRDYSGRSY